MSEGEFQKWLSSLFVAFPDLMDWVNGLPDKQGTMATWRKTLNPFSLAECALALDWWIEGRTPAPKAYDRAHTALLLRSAIEHQRGIERREQLKADQLAFASGAAFEKKHRDEYDPLPGRPNVEGLFERAFERRMKMLAGKMTLDDVHAANTEDRERQKQEIKNAKSNSSKQIFQKIPEAVG